MPGLSPGVRKGLAVIGIVAASVGVHVAMATHRGMMWAGILVIAEAVLLAWVVLSFAPAKSLRWAGCAVVLVLTAAIWRLSPDGIVASSAIPHAIAYISVLTIFALSLLPRRKAIVTIFAERSRGELSPEVVRYTRRVTWAWCAFCVFQLLGSLLLMVFAPVQVWSAFVNVFNLPLLVIMFCGEFAWRKWRHGSWPRERLTDGFRMAGQIGTATTRDPA